MYFNVEVSKYTLPDEIAINKTNVINQDISSINEKYFFVLGNENTFDFDNSINSLVGC